MMDSLPQTVPPRAKAPAAKSATGGSSPSAKSVSHNLNGQRLGRKGRDTRDRIISAAQTLLAGPDPTPLTLSAVAREASLGMTSLYLYFNDLTELLLAVLEPVMATGEEAYLGALRPHWSNEGLNAHCHDFVLAYYDFWNRHSRLLHLRNNLADQQDRRMRLHRVRSAQQIITLLAGQMDKDAAANGMRAHDMATVLMTTIERFVTMATDSDMRGIVENDHPVDDTLLRLRPVARLMELGIREFREDGQGPPAA